MKKWNLYKALLSLAFCSFFTFFSGSSFATVVAPVMWHNSGTSLIYEVGFSSLDYCLANYPTAVSVVESASTSTTTYQHGLADYPGISFYFKRTGQLVGQCKDGVGAPIGGATAVFKTAFCEGGYPAGTAPNYTCTSCPSGMVESGGSCSPPPDCPAPGSMTYPTALDGGLFIATQSSPPSTGPNGTSFCLPYNGELCEVKCNTGVAGPNPIASGYAVACTSLSATGNACPSGASEMEVNIPNPLEVEPETGPGTEPNDPGDCPPGTGFAQINNKKSCLPSGTSGTGESKSTSSSNGVETDSKTDWEINADGTRTETTTTSVTQNGETTTQTKTETSGVDGQDGKDGKDFDPGPPPTWNDPGNGGDATDLVVGELPAIDWHQVYLPEDAACSLVDIPVTVMGTTITIPLSSACQYLAVFRGLVIFLSVLASIRMFAMAPW